MLEQAKKFAELLDRNNFEDAKLLLAENCMYHYNEGNYSGRENIMNLYRMNDKKGAEIFDEVQYSSDVEPLDEGTFKINFYDKLRLGPKWHTYQCYQVLKIQDDLIVDIKHHEIPGQTLAMRAFYQKAKSFTF